MRLKITALLFFQLIWSGLSFGQNDDSWLRRNWHNMNARFNGLYHAEELINQSVRTLQKEHTDNFDQVISVFPFGNATSAQGIKGNMDEAYKKASKVIRKHPRSRWVDDSWFLIGKSYFFKYEPESAIETFQHVINQYPDGERKYDAKLWIVHCYLQQEKYYDAEAIMSLLNNEGNFPKRLQKEIAALSAEIYIRQDKYAQAIEQMEKALELARYRDDKSRYHFILGQLKLKVNNVPESKSHYLKTIKLNPPYDLAFQANLGLIQTISLSADKSLKTPRKHLKKMLRDDKNIDYYDQIYYQLALLELKDGNRDMAIQYFQESARTSSSNKTQKANSYLQLARLFFESREYDLSQKYFDSTAMFVTEEHPQYETILAQQLVLTDLIDNLVTVRTNDSLLELAALPRPEIDKRINETIRLEKQRAEEAARQKNTGDVDSYQDQFNNPRQVDNNTMAGGSWYFYNPSAVSRGVDDYKRRWGSRTLTDNWRIASLASQTLQPQEQTDQNAETDSNEEEENLTYNPANDKETQDILKDIEESKRKYYEAIPFTDAAKKATKAKIAVALFGAAKIYKEDLKELKRARELFQSFLDRFPGHSLEPEAYFHMYRLAEAEGNTSDKAMYGKLLNDKYPKSPFNMVINNREVVEGMGTEKEISKLYEQMYQAYVQGNYDEALGYKAKADEKFAGNALQAKFDYLRALIIGKTQGEDAYVKELTRIRDNYPGTTIANTAKYTLELISAKKDAANQQQNSNQVPSKYAFKPQSKHYFITLYDGGTSASIQAAFNDYNKEQHRLKSLRVGSYLVGQKNVIAIQTFDNKDEAEKYYVEFIKKDQFFKGVGIRAYENYTISEDNFRILLGEQNAEGYAEFFFNNYIQ
ncbi:MAG: tetratricopeptide repeat protein [Bacteroidetes bacterium]|nr:tetratricopeptide repeat protein [Bacteroidota bacterium]